MGDLIYINGKSYNPAFLLRCKCFSCGECAKDENYFFFRINFRRDLSEECKNSLEKDYGNTVGYPIHKYICSGCLTGIVQEYPEIINELQRCFPR